jgi:hypothetical protein
MNTYIKVNRKWQVAFGIVSRNLKWHEWFNLRFIQLRDWLHLLGKEK